MASLIGGPLFLKFLGHDCPLNLYPQSLQISKFAMKNTTVIRRNVIHHTATHCADVVKTIAELNMARESGLYILVGLLATLSLPCLSPCLSPIMCGYTPAYEHGDDAHTYGKWLRSIANILLIIGAGGAFNAILKAAVSLIRWQLFSPICICTRSSGLVSGSYSACGSGLRYRGMMGATAIVAPMLPLYPDISRKLLRLLSVQVQLAALSLRTAFLASEAILRRYAQ